MQQSYDYAWLLAQGAWTTVLLSIAGCALALLIAFAMGFARLAPNALIRFCATVFVEFFRGSSVFVQLFWVFYVMPIFGIKLEPFTAAVLVLGANVGSFGSEVVRSGIKAVPREQFEACTALNLRTLDKYRHVILPQALRIMLPSFANQAVELSKISAVVSLITVADATFQVNMLRSVTGNTLVPYLALLVFYYLLASCWVQGIRLIGRRLEARGGHRV